MKPFVFKKRITFFSKEFFNYKLCNLKKYLLILKKNFLKSSKRNLCFEFLTCTTSLYFYFTIMIVDTLRLILFRRKLNIFILNNKIFDILVHTKF